MKKILLRNKYKVIFIFVSFLFIIICNNLTIKPVYAACSSDASKCNNPLSCGGCGCPGNSRCNAQTGTCEYAPGCDSGGSTSPPSGCNGSNQFGCAPGLVNHPKSNSCRNPACPEEINCICPVTPTVRPTATPAPQTCQPLTGCSTTYSGCSYSYIPNNYPTCSLGAGGWPAYPSNYTCGSSSGCAVFSPTPGGTTPTNKPTPTNLPLSPTSPPVYPTSPPEPTEPPTSLTNTPVPGKPSNTPPPFGSCAKKGQGDANCDGKVDMADYAIWKMQFDKMPPPVPANSNANFSCSEGDKNSYFVDLIEFEIWRRNTSTFNLYNTIVNSFRRIFGL